ncbi:MAG: thiamine pyrophosphate-dependent enzyme [Bacteroidota bacterium]
MLDNTVASEPNSRDSESDSFVKEVLNDYRICCISREMSLMARKDVLTGKGKFGITGDGKEVPQVAMARAFKKGDWRSGYYRDQTFMLALGLTDVESFFAQLYADAQNDPFSGGRQMNSHYASPAIDERGEWLPHKDLYNSSADVSCTGGQMARAMGLAFASKIYRESEELSDSTGFSQNGDEVCFCTIGDASTSEGVFWETINAACVTQVPLAISVWDDGYGISVPKKFQTTKESISNILEGFRLDEQGNGMDIYCINGWDYPALCEAYEKGIAKVRRTHIPALFHIEELTQPQGHSTSGSHERYKSKGRLEWERQHDCIKVMRQWMIDAGIADEAALEQIQQEAKQHVKEARRRAWDNYYNPVSEALQELVTIYESLDESDKEHERIVTLREEIQKAIDPLYAEVVQNARRLEYHLRGKYPELTEWLKEAAAIAHQRYHTYLYSESPHSALKVPVVPAVYSEGSKSVNGFQVLNACFDAALNNNPAVHAFGEDVGQIGDVNQGFAGLQDRYGKDRVFDTGIREWTIMGQAIGMSMRGLRPIAEIQYLDYLIYGLEPLSDDLATLRYRSNNLQQAPAIIRTRGHRLEGIWHSGSPIGMLLHALRGMYICVPRNMTQAAGMYNTFLKSDDPALIIECLNGYRLKERLPDNIGEFTVPLGVPEVLSEGTDVTLVTYGSCVRIAQRALELLRQYDVSVELIDVQTLLPFDLEHRILASLKKTNRIVFLDEDVPGGASSYMMQQVLEVQGGYRFLDSAPTTITAKAHRPPYGSDGDYFSKPSPEAVFEAVYALMKEADPIKYF